MANQGNTPQPKNVQATSKPTGFQKEPAKKPTLLEVAQSEELSAKTTVSKKPVEKETPQEKADQKLEEPIAGPSGTGPAKPAEVKDETEKKEEAEKEEESAKRGSTDSGEETEEGSENNKEEKPKERSAAEDVKDKAIDKIKDKGKEKAKEAVATAATGGWGKIIIFVAKYGKYILVIFIFFLIVLFFVFQSGLFGGSGVSEPIDAQKNQREIKKIKAVAVQGQDQGQKDTLYQETAESLKKNIQDLQNYLQENENQLDSGIINQAKGLLEEILAKFNEIKPDLDKLRELEAKEETELKVKDPDEWKDRQDLRKKVDEAFSSMWKKLLEIKNILQIKEE